MDGFGDLLKKHRNGCRDPLTGKPLTQERLGEEIGRVLGGGGYSAVAISNWERSKNKINADDRRVLAAIVEVLFTFGGLSTAHEGNRLLRAGNYRALNETEQEAIFGTAPPPPRT